MTPHAPAVAWTVQRSHFAGLLMLGLWLCGALLVARNVVEAGSAVGAGAVWRGWIFAAALLGTGAFAAWQWRQAPQGTLRWDGQDWWWRPQSGSDVAGTPEIGLDLQTKLLVRWSGSDSRRVAWFWLDSGSSGSRSAWHALRCALHGRPHARSEARTDAHAPPAATHRPSP